MDGAGLAWLKEELRTSAVIVERTQPGRRNGEQTFSRARKGSPTLELSEKSGAVNEMQV